MFLKRIEKVNGERRVEIHECDSVSYTKTSKQIVVHAIKNGNEILSIVTDVVGVDFYLLNNAGKTVDSIKW